MVSSLPHHPPYLVLKHPGILLHGRGVIDQAADIAGVSGVFGFLPTQGRPATQHFGAGDFGIWCVLGYAECVLVLFALHGPDVPQMINGVNTLLPLWHFTLVDNLP
jgi:hypothetical protein